MISKTTSVICILSIVLGVVRVSNQFSTEQIINDQPNACQLPLIVQYLKNYKIQTNDLKQLIDTSINSFTINAISTKQVKFSQVKCHTTYTDHQSVVQISPVQYNVTGDSFIVNMDWVANVSKTIGSNSYNVTAVTKQIKVNYLKTFILQNNQFQISNVTYTFTPDMITVTSYKPEPSSAQKTKIQTVIKGELYNSLNQYFKSLGAWLNDAAKNQKISSTYPNNTYDYDYYKWILPIDTKTLSLSTAENNTYIHGYKGNIIGLVDQKCPLKIPDVRPKYTQFISLQFIQNFAKAVVDRKDIYNNILINSSWVRTSTFQFRLIDLQYVLSGALEKYGKYYLQPVTFTCSTKQLISGFISEDNKLKELVKWSCYGYLWTSNTTSVQIIDSQITISHSIQVFLNSNYLAVLDNQLSIINTVFNPVGDIIVRNKDLALIFMNQFLNDMRTYITGTYFKVRDGCTQAILEPDSKIGAGIWIG